MIKKTQLVMVTPATAANNNGNWRTAERWGRHLSAAGFAVTIVEQWQGQPADHLLALHARRSAQSITQFSAAHPTKPITLALTGTDLYKDLPAGDPLAQQSLRTAHSLIVLQPDALQHLPAAYTSGAQVVLQSAVPVRLARKAAPIRFATVGHLRAEKDPLTLFAALQLLPSTLPYTLRHIGAPLDPALGAAAQQLAAADPRYRYAGAQPYGLARIAIARAHALIHPSIMEGGAQAVIEAITSQTAVLASAMSGNIGLLGADYDGYFSTSTPNSLAELIIKYIKNELFRTHLSAQIDQLAPQFAPAREATSLLAALTLAGQTATLRFPG